MKQLLGKYNCFQLNLSQKLKNIIFTRKASFQRTLLGFLKKGVLKILIGFIKNQVKL